MQRTLIMNQQCDTCDGRCAGNREGEVNCQAAAADWLVTTIRNFGGSLATAHKVAGLWLSDSTVCPEVSA
jgi:hypothetical protein